MNPLLVDIDTLVQEAHGLDPLPAAVVRLAELVSGKELQVGTLATFFHADEALRERLYDWANQASDGPARRVSNVEGAVLQVGPGVLVGLALGTSIAESFQAAVPEYGLAEGELWTHSVAAALAIEKARYHCRRPITPEAFGAALLHDVGKLVLSNHLDARQVDLVGASDERALSDERAEMEILRICHAELGGMVLRRWELPLLLAEGVEDHHAPFRGRTSEARRLALQVGLADAVATTLGRGCGETYAKPSFRAALAGCLGITRDGFDALCREVDRRLETALAILR